MDTEDEFLARANSDISQLCGEIVLLWHSFLSAFVGKVQILEHLARMHHLHRVSRMDALVVANKCIVVRVPNAHVAKPFLVFRMALDFRS